MRKGYKGVWLLPKNVAREFQNLKVVPELLRIYIQSTGSVHNCPAQFIATPIHFQGEGGGGGSQHPISRWKIDLYC